MTFFHEMRDMAGGRMFYAGTGGASGAVTWTVNVGDALRLPLTSARSVADRLRGFVVEEDVRK